MGFLVSPAVEVKETDLTNVIPAVATSIGGFAGHFNWGSVGELVTVGSEKELAGYFGAPTASTALSFLTASSFLKYSSALRVSRAVASGALNAVAGSSGVVSGLLIKNKDVFDGILPSVITADRYVFARCPGAKGNSIKVLIAYGDTSYTGDVASLFDSAPGTSTAAAAAGIENDEIHVIVYDEDGEFTGVKGTVLETYAGLSLASDAKKEDGGTLYYKDVINQSSSYIFIASLADVFQNADKALGNADVIDDGFAYLGDSSVAASAALSASVSVVTQPTVSGNPVGDPITVVENHTFLLKSVTASAALGNNISVTFVKTPSTASTTASVVVSDEDNAVINVVVNLKTNSGNASLAKLSEIKAAIAGVTEDALENAFILDDYLTVEYNEDLDQVALAVYNPTAAVTQLQLSGGGTLAGGTLNLSLINGADGTADEGDVVDALDLFADDESVDVNFIFAENFYQGTGGYAASGQKTIDDKLIEIVHARKDVVTVISAPLEVSTATSDAAKKALVLAKANLITSTSYVVLDQTPALVYNKYADKNVWIPLAGHVLGLMANTDKVAEPWFSPAGYTRGQLLGISKLAYNPKRTDRDDLYKARVNSVVAQSGQGVLLFGDKTALSKPSAFDRINVRRLLIVLQKAIATAAKFQLFEINDEFTQAAFRNMVDPYLRDVKGKRGLYEFLTVCDNSNNTDQVKDSNGFVGDIYLKPSKSINYITLNFIVTRSGVEFSEIVGGPNNG